MPEQSKKPVQIRITEERKRRWKREADENVEYRSLTDLIVAGVENELREDPVVGEVDVDLNGVHDRLDSVLGEMREMGDTVDETYVMVRKDEMSNYTALTSRIQDLVPLGDRENILKRTPEKAARETDKDRLEAVVGRTGSVSHLTGLLQQEGYDPISIKGAVEQLADDVEMIEATYARPQEEEDKRIYRVED